MILQAKDISKEFKVEKGMFKAEAERTLALDKVSFILEEFTTLGLVGESLMSLRKKWNLTLNNLA